MILFYKSDLSEKDELKKLWLKSFDEIPYAVDLLFIKLCKVLNVYCAKINGVLCSAVYIINGSLNGKKAHYLCGASTENEYRGKGIMSALIEYALNEEKKSGCSFSLLFPATESLYSFYEKLGYKIGCFAEKQVYERAELEKFAYSNDFTSCDFSDLQIKCFKNNFLMQKNKFMNFADIYYKLYGDKIINDNGCFAIVEENNCCANVIYAAYVDFCTLCSRLLEISDAEQFIITDKVKNNSKKEKYGMIKSIDNSEIPHNVYLGITLS